MPTGQPIAATLWSVRNVTKDNRRIRFRSELIRIDFVKDGKEIENLGAILNKRSNLRKSFDFF